MLDFLSSVSDFFSTALSGLKNIIMAPIYIVEMVVSGTSLISQVINYVPTEIYVFMSAVLAISVLYLILNR